LNTDIRILQFKFGQKCIQRINAQRAVTTYGDIDAEVNNTQAIFQDLQKTFLPEFKLQYPDISIKKQSLVKKA
jgi:hypothetical protein